MREHRDSIPEGAGPGSRPAAGHLTTAVRPAPRHHIKLGGEGGDHGTKATCARVQWRIGGADLRGPGLPDLGATDTQSRVAKLKWMQTNAKK